jgi:hypothetical protein
LYGTWSSPAFPPTLGFYFRGDLKLRGESTLAKQVKQKGKIRKGFKDDILPLGRENFLILGLGLFVIAAGYLAMLEGSVEGFLPVVVAPILLVLGYCFIIPLGILYKKPLFSKNDAPPGIQSPQA